MPASAAIRPGAIVQDTRQPSGPSWTLRDKDAASTWTLVRENEIDGSRPYVLGVSERVICEHFEVLQPAPGPVPDQMPEWMTQEAA